jgi:hypothetical protein
MATANFNTQIISSNSDEQLQYNLDEVITKDFDSGIFGYSYNFNDETPRPIDASLSGDNNQILTIPPNTTFTLSIFVFNGDKGNPIEAFAITEVIIDTKLNFNDVVSKAFGSVSLNQKYNDTKNDWANIINRGTNEKVDDGIKYPGGDVIKEL